MNNLPFGTAEYRQFETTFLASVIVGITYPPVQNAASRINQWGEFSRALFSVEPLEGIFEKPIFINRNDHKLGYVFEKSRAQVHISGDGYQNYGDSVIPHAYKLKQFVTEVAGVNSPIELGIRKIDVFQIETDGTSIPDEQEIRNHFFSKDYCLLKKETADLTAEDQKIPGLKKHEWIEGANKFTLRSAFVKVKDTSNRYRLVLDIDEQYKPEGRINLEKLDVDLKKMNTDLFNAFMWCVSADVIKIMKNGKE